MDDPLPTSKTCKIYKVTQKLTKYWNLVMSHSRGKVALCTWFEFQGFTDMTSFKHQVLIITWVPRWLATIFNWMDYINLGLCFEMRNPSVALMMCYVSRAVFREVVLHAMTEDLGWYLALLSAKLSIACWHLSPGYLCSLDTSPSAIFLTNYKCKFSQIRKSSHLFHWPSS